MKDIVFITGNQHKVAYLQKWLSVPITHQSVDLEELQSLDLLEVVEHKAKSAYAIVQKPVLVEDISLQFHALGRLPGTFIKWFLQELGTDGLCDLVRGYDNKDATARIMYGLYDGETFLTFDGETTGKITDAPSDTRANDWNTALTWNSLFMPDGSDKVFSEMTDEELKPFSHRARAIVKLEKYLNELQTEMIPTLSWSLDYAKEKELPIYTFKQYARYVIRTELDKLIEAES